MTGHRARYRSLAGHEMIGDGGFVGQMNVYGQLVANGDPSKIADSWKKAVSSVLAGNDLEAWQSIRAIGKAAEIPETAADQAAARANPHPRFAKPGDNRLGNSLADLSLSVYGYALGTRAATTGWATPEAARADFATFLSASSARAKAIVDASNETR